MTALSRRPVLGSLVALIGAGLVLLVFAGLVIFGGDVADKIPSHTPTSLVNPYGAVVYEALASPDVHVTADDITKITLSPDERIKDVDPFGQLVWLGGTTGFRIALVAIVAVLLVLIAVGLIRRTSRIAPRVRAWATVVWANVAASALALAYVTRGARGTWDEIYVFASQARNFAQTGIAAVPITGPRPWGESSADLGVTVVGGTIWKFLPMLRIESALVVGYLAVIAMLSIGMTVILRRWHGFAAVPSILVPVALLVGLPQGLLSTAQAMPTGVSAGALAVYALVVHRALTARALPIFAVASVLVALVRWEYGIVAIVAGLVLIGQSLFRRRDAERSRWRARDYVAALSPIGFFLTETVYRLAVFGAWGPSGALSKSVGLDGAYLRSGLDYIGRTATTNLWPLTFAFAVLLVIIFAGTRRSAPMLVTAAIVSLPVANSLLAGGDWFPVEWERYILPTFIAVLSLGFATLGSRELPRRTRVVAIGSLATVSLITQLGVGAVMYQDLLAPETPARTNCLAQAGLAIARIVPADQGIASAEVNTVAYFAGAPVTDLIGLIDPRIASVPASPMTPGDLLHRRSRPASIYEDRPAAIYLYEVARCTGPDTSTPEADVDTWNELLNQNITRFRAGDVGKLLEAYRPVTLQVEGGILVRVLVRDDLLDR